MVPPRFARSFSTPAVQQLRSNQTAAVQEERPHLTIQVPSPVPYSIAEDSLGNYNGGSSVESVAYQSLIPPSPSTHNDNIRVLLRIRPPNPGSDADHKQQQQQQQQLALSRRCLDVAPDAKGVTLAPSTLQEKRFGFDHVFTETSSQEQIFMDIGVTAVENTINGFNGCIFAYGQTGSGKTFTMLGGTGSNDAQELQVSPLRGLIPRIFAHLFRRLGQVAIEKGNALEYALSCSYLEIYNEKIFDLLEENSSIATQQPKSLREDANKEVYVEQLRDVTLRSESDAVEWLQLGSSNRRMASTDMNRESSRSHAVFTIKLVQTERTASGVQFTRRSNLHLVDLAGSEKQRQTKASGQRLKEAAQINKSLSALGNVIMSLVDVSNGQKRHVHYRDSKLTFLLKDSLGGNAITTIVATISGEEKYFSETLSTLKFAQRAKYIKNKAVQNQDSDSMLPLLKQEIERLRQEIAHLRSGAPSAMALSPEGSRSSPSSHYQPQEQLQPQAQEPKKNRWEPALDVMDKLLRASGAAAPADLEEHEECNPVEIRCERLEMLLYRMICRYEEHKELAFSSDRFRHASSPLRAIFPMKSNLRAPKKYGVKQATENQQEGRFISPDEEKLILEEVARTNELERENNLMRQELCELLEWKALVEEERKHGNADATGYSVASPEQVAAQGHSEELMELLNVYRSLFDEMSDVLQEKRPMLSSPPSPGSGSSFTEDNSVSYASGGEEDGDERETRDFPADDNDVDVSEDGEVSETYREIRRAHAVSLKLERKLDQYQDVMQRLEKDLLATQDELETSSAATKFAEFQLQQLRNLASEEEVRQAELESTIAKLKLEAESFQFALSDAETSIEVKNDALEEATAKLGTSKSGHEELEKLRAMVASTQQDVGEKDRALEDVKSQLAECKHELDSLRSTLAASQHDAAAKDSTLEETASQLAAKVRALEDTTSQLAAKDHALEDTTTQLLACKLELESSRTTIAAAQVEIDAKDLALQEATDKLKTLKTELETLRFELTNVQQDIESKERVIEEANGKLHANRLELEALRSSLASAQSDIDFTHRALEDAKSQLESTHNDESELGELRSALTAARRGVNEKNRALDDTRYQLERLQMERDEIAQRFQHEKEKLEAKYKKSMREFEAREQQQDDKIRRLRVETPPNSTDEVVRLRRKSKSSEQEKAGIELALLAAQSIIQQLEDELASLRLSEGGGGVAAAAASAPGSANGAGQDRQQALQKELDAALAENAQLHETIRSLQVKQPRGKRRHSNVPLRTNSHLLSAEGEDE